MSKPNNLCIRSFEFNADSDTGSEQTNGRTMEGYAAVFDAPTEINNWEGRFTETLSRGAFKKTLSERKPVLQFDHGQDARTGSVPIGKFNDIREDDKGLYCEAELFDNPVVEPIRQAIEGGAVSGMSFRFKVNREEWRDKDGNLVKPEELGRLLYQPGSRGPLTRNIKEVQLFEAGPVVFPAYTQTSVGVRSLSEEDIQSLVDDYTRAMSEGSGAQVGDETPAEPNEVDTEKQPTNADDEAHVMEDGNCAVCGY